MATDFDPGVFLPALAPTATRVALCTGNVGVSCGHGTPPGVHCYACNPYTSVMSPVGPTFTLGGWACPGCRRGFSPAVTQCPYCGPDTGASDGECVPASEGGLCDHDEAKPCTSFNCDC
jgi:hypothetical protein